MAVSELFYHGSCELYSTSDMEQRSGKVKSENMIALINQQINQPN